MEELGIFYQSEREKHPTKLGRGGWGGDILISEKCFRKQAGEQET